MNDTSEFKSKRGLRRIGNALRYSIEGFKAAWEHEHAFRQELLMVIIGTVIALALPISAFQKLFLISVLILVLIVELINSAIEAIVGTWPASFTAERARRLLGFSEQESLEDIVQAFIEDDLAATKAERGL